MRPKQFTLAGVQAVPPASLLLHYADGEQFWNWMARNDLTLDKAAVALGVSRRMLAYYRSGLKPVPRTVALACLGWEEVMKSDEKFALAA